jgi:hypothetical protein
MSLVCHQSVNIAAKGQQTAAVALSCVESVAVSLVWCHQEMNEVEQLRLLCRNDQAISQAQARHHVGRIERSISTFGDRYE